MTVPKRDLARLLLEKLESIEESLESIASEIEKLNERYTEEQEVAYRRRNAQDEICERFRIRLDLFDNDSKLKSQELFQRLTKVEKQLKNP